MPSRATGDKCGVDARNIASIEGPVVIRKILTYLDGKAIYADLLLQCRAAPGVGFSLEVYFSYLVYLKY